MGIFASPSPDRAKELLRKARGKQVPYKEGGVSQSFQNNPPYKNLFLVYRTMNRDVSPNTKYEGIPNVISIILC